LSSVKFCFNFNTNQILVDISQKIVIDVVTKFLTDPHDGTNSVGKNIPYLKEMHQERTTGSKKATEESAEISST